MASTSRMSLQTASLAALMIAASCVQTHDGGLGVTRAELQEVFQAQPFGVVFETSSPVRGQPRVMGTTKDGLAAIELIGPAGNLTTVSCLLSLPNDSPLVVIQNAVILITLLKKALPNWNVGADWLEAGLQQAIKTGDARTTYRHAEIGILYVKALSMMTLTVRAD